MNGQVWMVFSLAGFVYQCKFFYLVPALIFTDMVLNFKFKLYERVSASDIFFKDAVSFSFRI